MVCYRHPERAAIEQCETCGRAVCAACLWYTEDGERLCEEHAQARKAQGEPVVSPERYVDAHDDAQADAQRLPLGPTAPYQGNTLDVLALVAAVIGAVAFAANFGALYVLPIFGVVLGLVAVLQAGQSQNRRRTATLGWVALGTSLAGILFWVVIFFGCVSLTFLPMLFNGTFNRNTGPVYVTSVPAVTPTP